MIPQLPRAVPELPVSDVDAATEYYRDKLSFSVDWLAADIALAGISRDQCRLFLAGPVFREECGNASPALTWLNLNTKGEVNDLHRAWRSTKVILLSDPESKPWGLHDPPQRIRTGTDSACSMTSRRHCANARGLRHPSITAQSSRDHR